MRDIPVNVRHINIVKRKLDFQARRMACAYTIDGRDVWATFIKRRHLESIEQIIRLRLHTAPALNDNAANLKLEDIDYTTIAKEFGKYTSRRNFESVALAIWSYYGDLEVRTRDAFEDHDRVENSDGDSCDALNNHMSNNNNPIPAKHIATCMTPGQALIMQAKYFLDEEVDRDRVLFSIKKYGIITLDRLTMAYDKAMEKAEQERATRRARKMRHRKKPL